ncbi:hypothetical protein [Streptomyces collinus]|uniref:hypothetical protein n=1 Tax=Streptomyces collinus TaxID=42684 RepID=UPI00368E6BAF
MLTATRVDRGEGEAAMGAQYYGADSENGDRIDDPSEDALFMMISDLNTSDCADQFGRLRRAVRARGGEGCGWGRPWRLPLAERVLLVAVYHRTNLTCGSSPLHQRRPIPAPILRQRLDRRELRLEATTTLHHLTDALHCQRILRLF